MFAFGRNWMAYLNVVDEARIVRAEAALRTMLGRDDLTGCRFLDAGSGSGLHSLAAHRLGADVVSFDRDPASIACALKLRTEYSRGGRWEVFDGSLLDSEFLARLGEFDVVYCWGVAHHTGAMWSAIGNLLACVSDGGLIALAIYNDQGETSRRWASIKRTYQALPETLRPPFVAAVMAAAWVRRSLAAACSIMARVATLRSPLPPIRCWIADMTTGNPQPRGMHWWYDWVDWVGGWPYEVADPGQVFGFLRDRGFRLREMSTPTGPGCSEYVFERTGEVCPLVVTQLPDQAAGVQAI